MDRNIADEVHRLSTKVEQLNSVLGLLVNKFTALSIYTDMETEMSAEFEALKEKVAVIEALKNQQWAEHNKAAAERAAMYKEEFEKINRNLEILNNKVDNMHNECLLRPPKCFGSIEEKITRRVRNMLGWVIGVPVSVTALVYCIKIVHDITMHHR